jgi:hypothetical protein
MERTLTVICSVTNLSPEYEVPQLNIEDAKRAIAKLKEAEVAIRHLRRGIEKQHAVSTPAFEQQDPGDDDDPLAIPEVFKRSRKS